ncbi:tetratricopeptide repeat protein [Raineya sp.]
MCRLLFFVGFVMNFINADGQELPVLWETKNKYDKNSLEHLKALSSLAKYYSERKILDSAFYYYYQALPIAEQLKNDELLYSLYIGLGNTLKDKGDFDKALYYFNNAIEYYTQKKDTNTIIGCVNNRALIYKAKNSNDQALQEYQYALKLHNKITQNNEEWYFRAIMLKNNIANLYILNKEILPAIKLLEEALILCEKTNNLILVASTQINLSEAYLNYGKHKDAESLLQKSLAIGLEIKSMEIVQESYRLLSDTYEKEQNSQKALFFFKKYDSVYKKIINETNLKQINELEAKYQTAKKDQAILRKEKELEKANYEKSRNYFLIWMLISLLLIAVVGLRNLYLRNKRQQAEKKVVACELERTLMIQEELKSQQEVLKHQLEYQQKELLSATLQKTQQQEAILQIKEFVKKSSDKSQENIQKIKQLIASTENLEKDWNEFKMRFEKIHENFFKNLQEKYPELTENDLRMCAFIKLHLDKKQIATLLNITPKAVEMSRYRLKKKFHLEPEEDLSKFIQNFE